MYNEPKQKNYTLHDPSVRKSLEIAKEYGYKVRVVYVSARAFLSVYEPFFKSPYPRHFTSVIRTARYVDAAFEEYNS